MYKRQALLCGLVYWKTRNLPATLAGEVFGTGIIGGLLSYPVAVAFMGVVAGSIAFYAYVAVSYTHLLDKVRRQRPLIHCVSNIVTANDCANLALAVGASPMMAQAPWRR